MSTTPLPFTLTADRVITVKGTTNADCDRFSINLCKGSEFSEDTPLHFNPRFSDEEVVRNSFDGGWGDEERDGGFPFTRDSSYEVKITVKDSHYEISVNGSHFCDYSHRQPIENVRNIYIAGDTNAHVTFTQSVFPAPFPVSDGVEILVYGMTHSNPQRFSINLCSGHDYNTDTPLHFNPRFDNNEVVRNHFNGGWGEEEKEGGFPFSPNAPYELKICVKEGFFQVFVNGTHFCHFNHRIDKSIIRNVFIAGDTDVSQVLFVDKTPINYPAIPVSTPIKGGLAPGSKVTITGKPSSDPERFSVNLVCGSDFDSSDLALHYDARHNYGDVQNYVVRTHRSGGDWGEEERDAPFFPFAPGAPFSMRIEVDQAAYSIYVNEQHHTTFAHRIQPVQSVDHIHIQGDVEISQIRFD